MLKRNAQVEVQTEDRSFFGFFRESNEDFLVIRGTVGDNIGKDILIPVRLILCVIVHTPVGRDDS